MTSIHPSSVQSVAESSKTADMLQDPERESTPENNRADGKPASPSKTFASINTTPRKLLGSSAAVETPTQQPQPQQHPVDSPISPSVTSTPARGQRQSEATTPLSSFAGRPPSSVPAQQRMLQSTFAVSQSPMAASSSHSFGGTSNVVSTPNTAKRTRTGSPKIDRQDEVTTGIYTATYSGIPVFEMMVNGVAVMRRRHDSSLNATQILKVAGVDKSKRTKILEREILSGTHEKVQGGYGKYQGTWIPYERGMDLCKQYSVFDLLQPLLVFDSTNPGMENTPTKEQAMAARRKRVSQYQPLHLAPPSTSSVLTFNNPLQVSGGFNTPLSHLASEALTTLGKPTRVEYQSRPGTLYPDELALARHVTSLPLNSENTLDSPEGSALKKQKHENTTLIPDDNFDIDENAIPESSTPLEPLDVQGTPNFENSKQLITQVFVDTESTNLAEIFGGEARLKTVDLDVPIDDLQHTALHWASVLARIPLVKDLIHHGANILRANYAGESGLIRAVLVTNNSDLSSFPQLLDLLYPAIPLVDKVGRSVLHHIALTAGIKGRSDASKYYLSCLLEWIVKRGNKNENGRLSLGRFIQDVVNAQDKNGDTALNIAACVGNQHIAQQLLEVGADATIPNRAGLRPIDFGVRVNENEKKKLDLVYALSNSTSLAARVAGQTSHLNQLNAASRMNEQHKEERSEIARVVNSLVSEAESAFEQEFKAKDEEIQQMHQELREANIVLEENKERLKKIKAFSDSISRDKRRAENLERAIEEEDTSFRAEEERQGRSNGGGIDYESEFNPDQPFLMRSLQKIYDGVRAESSEDVTSAQIRDALVRELKSDPSRYADLPAKSFLRARIKAYKTNEERLKSFANELRSRSVELEQKFRRIVAQCASIKESQVDSLLEGLVQAVESDPGEVDLSRVAGFLRKVDDGVSF